MYADRGDDAMNLKNGLAVMVTLSLSLSLPPAVAGQIRVGFSPEGSAHALVLDTIAGARTSVRMMAYDFTDRSVARALVAARERGVDVRVVIDERGNRSRASQAVMQRLVSAGIPLRTDADFKIQHDKVIIVDDKSVETGSYNYTISANQANSENAILIEDDPALATQYLAHWQDRWQRGQDVNTRN